MPYHYRFILSHSSQPQLGFKPCSLPPVTYSRPRGREQDFRFLWGSAETREREGRGRRPRGAWETGRATSAHDRSLPGRYHKGPPSSRGLWSFGARPSQSCPNAEVAATLRARENNSGVLGEEERQGTPDPRWGGRER